MQIIRLEQGSEEWLEFRSDKFPASEAPAMLGVSPYKTRSELLREKATGIVKEVDAATQARFDAGHEYEKFARARAEQIIGSDLYPVTGYEGKLSASFDGITMNRKVIWEHKTPNAAIRAAATAADLPEYLRVQMEQQLMLSGAEKCLFMASSYTSEGEQIEEITHWYASDAALRTRIIQGWAQFGMDLQNYQPTDEVIDAPIIAEATGELMAPSVQVSGELVIHSNLNTFGDQLRAFVEKLNMQPTDDQGFADADAAVKTLKKAEEALNAVEAQAISQTGSMDELRSALEQYRTIARNHRLALEKMVKTRKDQIREEIVFEGKQALNAYVAELEKELHPARLQKITADFAGAIKGKRTLSSLREAVAQTLTNAKIELNEAARLLRENLAMYRTQAAGFEFLFSDLTVIIHKPAEDLQLLIKTRIEAHEATAKRNAEEAAQRELERLQAEAEKAEVKKAPEPTQTDCFEPEELGEAAALSASVQGLMGVNRTPARPEDSELVQLVASRYRINIETAAEWLQQIDFSAFTKKAA